jgi:thermostable 8-oxoguanine DNA glycosylase
MKMEFDIHNFARGFKNTIDWMLRSNHAKEIKNDLKDFKENKNLLQKDPNSLKALRTIVELIKTNGWRLKLPRGFDSKWNSFVNSTGTNFRTSTAKKELIKLVGDRKKKSIEQLLKYPTLRQFTDVLYNLAKQGKTEVLGEKGRDNYLRDFGYWDRIPIDRHEMRFIIRSGIYHACSSDKSDPLEKSDLQAALNIFCANYLKGHIVEEIDLGNAPGIVDIFIWSFSAEDRYNICVIPPKCENCNLKGVCLYALQNHPRSAVGNRTQKFRVK